MLLHVVSFQTEVVKNNYFRAFLSLVSLFGKPHQAHSLPNAVVPKHFLLGPPFVERNIFNFYFLFCEVAF